MPDLELPKDDAEPIMHPAYQHDSKQPNPVTDVMHNQVKTRIEAEAKAKANPDAEDKPDLYKTDSPQEGKPDDTPAYSPFSDQDAADVGANTNPAPEKKPEEQPEGDDTGNSESDSKE